MGELVQAPVEKITVPGGRLRGNMEYSPLAESIREIGLIHPITITEAGVLVSGRQRLEAVKSLGWKTVPAFVVEDDDLKNRLYEIDENLRRVDLTVYEQAQYAAERERVLEALGMRKKSGDNRFSSPATVAGLLTTEDLAREAGVSERTWQNRTRIGRSLGPKTTEVLDMADLTDEKHRQFLNSTGQLNHLVDIARKRGDEVAAEVAQRVLAGESTNTFAAYKAYKEASGEDADPEQDDLLPPELPNPNLTPAEKAYYQVSKAWLPFVSLDPEEVAKTAEDPQDAERHAETVDQVIAWLVRYREALRAYKREMLNIRRVK